MDSVRTSELRDKLEAVGGENGEVYIHTCSRDHLGDTGTEKCNMLIRDNDTCKQTTRM